MMSGREGQTLYGVTYRDESGKAWHVRVWALDADEAVRHVASHNVGFGSLERVIIPRNDPFPAPGVTR